MRQGDTLVVPKLDRLARSVPDARAIADQLQERGVKLALGPALYDPNDPMGKMFFNILATFAEFETDLSRIRTREGMDIARAKGKLRGKQPQTVRPAAAGTLPHACHRRVFHQRSRRTLLGLKTNRLSHTQPASRPLAYDPALTGIDPLMLERTKTLRAVIIPRIFRLDVVTCLAVVVMVVACSGGSEPALPAETVAVGTTTQPANTLVPAPTATPVLTAAPMATPGPTTELTNG